MSTRNLLYVALTTSALGIFPSDLILRSAIIKAIADLRANPFLLDYVFAALPADNLTKDDYGQKEVDAAKLWFQNTNIPVFLNINVSDAKFPCITIGLQSSVEQDQEGTLGDINFETSEDNDSYWPTLLGPITPDSYDQLNGVLTFNNNQLGTFVIVPGMLVVDKYGNQYEIVDVEDTTLTIVPGSNSDFEDMVIKPQRPAYRTALESTIYRESYIIGCYVDSEPVHLIYLHSILIFILLRYKQILLEARGFERTVLSSSDFRRDDELLPEIYYSRYTTITGTVRQYWPKIIARKIDATIVDAEPSTSDTPGITTLTNELNQQLNEDVADKDIYKMFEDK